ncbi:hypothetical protein ISCGN_008195 [Ixodes scapularis]
MDKKKKKKKKRYERRGRRTFGFGFVRRLVFALRTGVSPIMPRLCAVVGCAKGRLKMCGRSGDVSLHKLPTDAAMHSTAASVANPEFCVLSSISRSVGVRSLNGSSNSFASAALSSISSRFSSQTGVH